MIFLFFKSNNYVHFVYMLHFEEDTKTIPQDAGGFPGDVIFPHAYSSNEFKRNWHRLDDL